MRNAFLFTAVLLALSFSADAQISSPPGPGPVPPCTGDCTFSSVNVTGSNIPANGMYLTAANAPGFSTNSSLRVNFDSAGDLADNSSSGWSLRHLSASATAPSLVPNKAATTTGIGAQASGNVSLIAAATEIMRFTSTGPLAITLPTDAATTDNSMCINTSTHIMSSGTGTLGICLGTSSARYKHDIAPLIPGLDQILALKPKSYYLNADHGDPKKQLYGFIAEDMFKVLPKLVGLDKQGRPNTADYMGVVPVLVKAMQQQQAEITALRAVNVDLRAANSNFGRRLAALEAHQKLAAAYR